MINKYQKTLLLFIFTVVTNCLQVHIAPPMLDSLANTYEQEGLPSLASEHKHTIKIEFTGKDITKEDWPQAISISRFFFSGIHNKSGSLQDLLKPAISKLMQTKGYQVHSQETTTKNPHSETKQSVNETSHYKLLIDIEKNILLWLPPVEFIQTPKARRRGNVQIDFVIHTKLVQNLNFLGELEPASQWENTFKKKSSISIFPGNEKEAIELIGHESLQAYLGRLAKEVPLAK